jgi:hypothetical protein
VTDSTTDDDVHLIIDDDDDAMVTTPCAHPIVLVIILTTPLVGRSMPPPPSIVSIITRWITISVVCEVGAVDVRWRTRRGVARIGAEARVAHDDEVATVRGQSDV